MTEWWDSLTHAISEIDDYAVGIGKGIASAFLDDGQLIDSPNKKKNKQKSALSGLTEDWYNDSAKAKELTWNLLDTPVNFTLNSQSQSMLTSKLIRQYPEKYSGPNGWEKAKQDSYKLAFGERKNLAWYEQDPNRVQYGEAYVAEQDKNAPILKSLEERQQYWANTDSLDDTMWITLGAMIIFDPLNFIPGSKAKDIEKVRDIQNVIDAINDAKTTDEAMEVVKGFNWQDRLPLTADPETMKRSELYKNKPTPSDIFFGPLQKPINGETYQLEDIKKIKKQLLEIHKNEIRGLVDDLELQRIQREITLDLTQRSENLIRSGTPEYSVIVAELTPMFKSYENLSDDIKAWLPNDTNFEYANLGNEIWGISNNRIFRWIPKVKKDLVKRIEESEDFYVRGIKENIKTTKQSKTTGGKWQLINVLPKHQPAFIKELIQEPYTRLPEDIGRDVKFYSDKLGFTKENDYIGHAAMPVEDTSLLHLPIFRNEKISGTQFQKPLPPNVRGATKTIIDADIPVPVPFKLAQRTLSFDPKVTRFIEVTVTDTKGNPRKLQLAVVNDPVDGGVYHLDWYRRTQKPKTDFPTYTDEAVDQLLTNGLVKVKGDRQRAAVATNLLNRLTPEQFAALPKEDQKWIARWSDEEWIATLEGKDVVSKEEELAGAMAEKLHYDPQTGEFLDTVDDDSSISDFFYKGLDDSSTADFNDEFGDGIEDAFSSFDQGIRVVNEPRVKSDRTFLSEKKPIWVFDGKFRWDKVTGYSGTYVNHITGQRSKYVLDSKYRIVNPVEVSNGAAPRIVEARNPQGTVYTFDATNELIPFSEFNSVKTAYDDTLLRTQAEVAELHKRMIKHNIEAAMEKENRLANVKTERKSINVEEELKRLEDLKKTDPEKYKQEIQGAGNPVVEQQIADEVRLEELKQRDPYAYQSYMERTYGAPRKVSFGFDIKYDQSGNARVSFLRTTQEIDGYGDYQKFVGDPVEEVVHTWEISKKDLQAINDRMATTNGITATSKTFKKVFLGEDIVVKEGREYSRTVDPITGQIVTGKYADEVDRGRFLTLDYKDLDRFGEPRWQSTTPSYAPYIDLLDEEISKAVKIVSQARASLAKIDPNNAMRKGTRDSLQDTIDTFTARIREFVKYKTSLPETWTDAMTDLGENAYRGRKVIPPTGSFTEIQFSRWLAAFNYYGKTKVGIMDNLPVNAMELDGLRKSAIAKSTEALKAEENVEPVVSSNVRFANITDNPDGIFVFGSNLAGRHGKGAALDAKNTYGAQTGVGQGLTGKAYALPTKGKSLEKLGLDEIKTYVDEFLNFAEKNSDKTFYVTSFGTGLAGNKVEDIAKMFDSLPDNIRFTSEPNGSPNALGVAINKLNEIKSVSEPAPITMGKVVRVKDADLKDPNTVYIGRPRFGQSGEFGNPFPVNTSIKEEAAKIKEVKRVVAQYSEWLTDKIKTDPEYANKIYALKGKTLACPGGEPNDICHGQEIFKAIKYLDENPELLGKQVATEVAPTTLGKVTIHSGGAAGADTAFAEIASELGLPTKAHTFEGHLKGSRPSLEEPVLHSQKDLDVADELLRKVNRDYLDRAYPPSSKYITNLLKRNYYQVKDSDAVIAVSRLDRNDNNTVSGGTAWAVYMGVELNKPVYFFDMNDKMWFKVVEGGEMSSISGLPPKFNSFAGIGSRELTPEGKQAIKEYLEQYRNAE
jgi:hypothetical protein